MLLLAIAVLFEYYLSYCPFHWKCLRLLFWTFILLVLLKALFSVVCFSSFIRGSPISRSRSLRGLVSSLSRHHMSHIQPCFCISRRSTRERIYISVPILPRSWYCRQLILSCRTVQTAFLPHKCQLKQFNISFLLYECAIGGKDQENLKELQQANKKKQVKWTFIVTETAVLYVQ